MNAKISVVMPAHNAQKFIRDAIESILSQSLTDFEFIIIDDASSDLTPCIIEEYSRKDKRIQVLRNSRNEYVAKSLNMAISESSAEFVAIMHADDISLQRRLEYQYALIQQGEMIAAVGGDVQVIDEEGNNMGIMRYPVTSTRLKKVVLRHSPIAHPAAMFRKGYFFDCGCYNPARAPAEDLDLWMRLGAQYELGSCPQIILKYRHHKNSESYVHLRRIELITFKIRFEAVSRYGYKPGLGDILYNAAQLGTAFLMPKALRFRLFFLLRQVFAL